MPDALEIREQESDDWAVYSALRLHGLKESPRGFGSTWEIENLYTETQWRDWLLARRYAVLVLFDKDEAVGMAVLIDNIDHKRAGEVISLYVKETHRGRSLSGYIIHACMQKAAQNKEWQTLEAHCREGNEASQKSFTGQGFTITQKIIAEWPGGIMDMRYDLGFNLEDLRRAAPDAEADLRLEGLPLLNYDRK